jgi:leucyl-tRNA synthetase
MAKSLKNVVNPDDVIREHGADTLRLYETFMGPLADSKPWNPRDIAGCRRFVERVWRLIVDPDSDAPVRPHLKVDQEREIGGESLEIERALNRAVKRIDDSFQFFNFNTGVAALMELVNVASKRPEALTRSQAERLVLALAPFAPHVCEELWQRLGNEGSLARAPWPRVRREFLEDDEVEIPVQVNGKLRGRTRAAKSVAEGELIASAKTAVGPWIEGKEVVKTVVVPGRLVNLIVR